MHVSQRNARQVATLTTGERLRSAREARGMSRPVLAGLVGRSADWLKKIETGDSATAPFADPRVGRFGRSLPVEWRAGKRLLRLRLALAGLPQSVTHPRRGESFAATMRLTLRRHAAGLLSDMLEHSPLLDQGLVSRNAVDRLRRHARWGRPLPPTVFDMLTLDIGIRSMMTAAATRSRFEELWATSPPPV